MSFEEHLAAVQRRDGPAPLDVEELMREAEARDRELAALQEREERERWGLDGNDDEPRPLTEEERAEERAIERIKQRRKRKRTLEAERSRIERELRELEREMEDDDA